MFLWGCTVAIRNAQSVAVKAGRWPASAGPSRIDISIAEKNSPITILV
jgi:hypothetical protein